MNWYITKLVFEIQSGSSHTHQFDEQLRLIQATNEQEAFFKARILGAKEEDSFLSHALNSVNWKFIDVVFLDEMKEMKDGVEICSRIHETDPHEQYVTYIKAKALSIEKRFVSYAVSS